MRGENVATGRSSTWRRFGRGVVLLAAAALFAPAAMAKPPTISLSASSTSFPAPGTTTITADAAATVGIVTQVLFFADGTQICKDLTAPFNCQFSVNTAGTYQLTGIARDSFGQTTTSATLTITATSGAPNKPPVISLSAPSNAMHAPGSMLLTATASDPDGTVAKVQFFNGGTSLGTVTSPPFTFNFSPNSPGTYNLTATATDNGGASATSNTVVVTGTTNYPPIVSLSAGATILGIPGSTLLTVSASDPDGRISSVVIMNGSTTLATLASAPYTYTFSTSVGGTFPLRAIATDNAGDSATSNVVTITAAQPNKPPTVSLAAGSTSIAVPGSTLLTATASDPDGTIAKVVFMNGSTPVATVTSAPFTYNFSTSVAGTFNFTAVATDNLGGTATSTAVAVTAAVGGGGTSVTLATAATTIPVPGTALLTATPTTNTGTISRVQFKNGATTLATVTKAPFTYNFTSGVVGTFTLTAVVTTSTNATATSGPVTVTAANGTPGNKPPNISLSINAHQVVAPTSVTLTATGVTDPDAGGSITRVSFYQNGVAIANLATTPYTLSVPINTVGKYTFAAEAQDNAGGITRTVTQDVVAVNAPTAAAVNPDIWRLLNQATFGASQAEAARVVQLGGIPNWINDQFTQPTNDYPDTKYNRIQLSTSFDCSNNDSNGAAFAATSLQAQCVRDHLTLAMLQRDFFLHAVSAPDQLRQRVAWALSQIIVTSGNEPDLSYAHVMSRYQNLMFKHAFGNFQQLLMEVTLNPAMGNYLDMVNNDRASGTRVPNENYAREIMQLFSVGLSELNLDGTPIVDATGMPVPTYDQNTIKEFAKVFTGWTYADPANPAGTTVTAKRNPYYALPLLTYPSTATAGHEPGAKTLLNGTPVAAGQTPLQDIQSAVLNVFMHPNTPVYIGKQLIQRLVTGNPSAAYVQRIANVFVDNGAGVRGDLKAVVKAILLDPEARGGGSANDPTYGTLREPVLMITSLIRAMSTVTDGNRLEGAASAFGQRPYYSPTVFNYFPPDNTVTGMSVLAPEFAIHTSNSAITRANTVYTLVYNGYGADTTIPNATGTRLYTAQFDALAATPAALVDQVDLVLTGGTTPAAAKAQIVTAVNAVAATSPAARSQMAVYLLASSYFYQVQH